MLENFQGDSWGSIPPLRMPSLLPHDLCHGRSSSRWLPAVIDFQLSYSRSWKMMLWKVLHSACNMHSICNMPAPGTLSFTISQSLLKYMSIESVTLSNHLILRHLLLLLPSIFPSIRVFSNVSALCITWAKYWTSLGDQYSATAVWKYMEILLRGKLVKIFNKQRKRRGT